MRTAHLERPDPRCDGVEMVNTSACFAFFARSCFLLTRPFIVFFPRLRDTRLLRYRAGYGLPRFFRSFVKALWIYSLADWLLRFYYTYGHKSIKANETYSWGTYCFLYDYPSLNDDTSSECNHDSVMISNM